MDVVSAMLACCLYLVVTMEAQATAALLAARLRSRPGRRAAPQLGWKVTDALCVFFATYAWAYIAMSVLAPGMCYIEHIAGGVAGVVNIAITGYNIPLVCSCAACVALLGTEVLLFSDALPTCFSYFVSSLGKVRCIWMRKR
jgi:hypothetical protein